MEANVASSGEVVLVARTPSRVLPITLLALLIDVIANYTELALLTLDFPRQGEYTFSQRCSRLKLEDNWGGKVARACEPYVDMFDPDGDHY